MNGTKSFTGYNIAYLPILYLSIHNARYLSDLNEYWGRGDVKNYKEDTTIKPFKISYSAEVSKRKEIYKLIFYMNCDYLRAIGYAWILTVFCRIY